MQVQDVIREVIKKTGIEPLPEDKTCDKLVAGTMDMEVKKVATTFMATIEVIEQAAKEGVNFIIAHEPTWFNGNDEIDTFLDDPIYLKKKELIESYHMAIWRFHDHMHMAKEDGIYRGFDEEFGWGKYKIEYPDKTDFLNTFGAAYKIPKTTLLELSKFFKEKMNMEVVQIVGNPEMTVETVGVLVGGGSLGLGDEKLPMRYMKEKDIDVAICGDITEWTLSAYVRDASQMGMRKGMLVLGHERSEEPGMKHMPEWMKSFMGDTKVIFLDAKEPFSYI